MHSSGSSIVLLKKDFVEVSYDEQHQIIITQWKGTLNAAQVRLVLEFKAAFIRERGVAYNLNDHTELKVLAPEVQQYLIDEGHPMLERVGLKKIAVKLAKDIFAQATVRKVNRSEKKEGLQIETFSNYKDAYAWLLEE